MKAAQKQVAVKNRHKVSPRPWDKFCDLRAVHELLRASTDASGRTMDDVIIMMEMEFVKSQANQSPDFYEAFAERSVSDRAGVLEMCLTELVEAGVVSIKTKKAMTYFSASKALVGGFN